MLHVRLPLRDQSSSQGRRYSLHRRQPRPPGQPRSDLRQGCLRHHAAALPGETEKAAQTGWRTRLRRVPRNRMGGGDRYRGRVAVIDPRRGPEEARILYWPRSEPVADQLLGSAIWDSELCRAWWVLLGQYGGSRNVHSRWELLGIRRA